MQRRLAILDDNQRLLEARVMQLKITLPPLVATRVCALTIIGSVAEGRARDDSDIDVLAVLDRDEPRRRDYRWWDEAIAPRLAGLADRSFPVQPVFVARSALSTEEPHLRWAIDHSLPLWDPEGLLA